MHGTSASSLSSFKTRSRFGEVMLGGVFIFAMAATVRGQAASPKTTTNTQHSHWHKYVNRQYGFSFWYPDTYRSVPAQQLPPDRAQYFPYMRFLASLREQNNPDGSCISCIDVSIELRPFDISRPRGNADGIPLAQRIGRHFFYSYLAGSMGVGFDDNWDMNLKGKTLTFTFGPDVSGVDPGAENRQLELKILSTLRTF